MTNRILSKTLGAALVVGLIGGATMAPAEAGGRFSWTYAPADRQNSDALATGLRLYSLYNDIRGAGIRQKGRDNRAGIGQNGRDNLGLVEQRGNGNSGTLQQNGDGNTYGLFQFGRGAEDRIVQDGNGSTGTTFSYGW